MVSREDCITAINKFIKDSSLKNAITLIEYLCEVKQLDNPQEAIESITAVPTIIPIILNRVLIELETEFKLTRVTDKNNTLITVF